MPQSMVSPAPKLSVHLVEVQSDNMQLHRPVQVSMGEQVNCPPLLILELYLCSPCPLGPNNAALSLLYSCAISRRGRGPSIEPLLLLPSAGGGSSKCRQQSPRHLPCLQACTLRLLRRLLIYQTRTWASVDPPSLLPSAGRGSSRCLQHEASPVQACKQGDALCLQACTARPSSSQSQDVELELNADCPQHKPDVASALPCPATCTQMTGTSKFRIRRLQGRVSRRQACTHQKHHRYVTCACSPAIWTDC